ncbi:MAG: NAD-dependent epimerase/dehydratase family protein [Anaerolineaceae bacterium]|nr:NAD-dependent epimerase/dehydratase family protein [Anaerolineaceae bacterium]
MKLLIIGGTRFLGRALVDSALAREHQITLFNRGQSNPDLFNDLETIIGDRETDLSKLGSRKWDAVIDTCGYLPRIVKTSAEFFSKIVDQYVFISTLSVYDETDKLGVDESGRLGTLQNESIEEINSETYGPLKVLCEQAVEQSNPEKTLIIRPGLIVGPHDPTDRFTYWPMRVSRGGDILVPGRKNRRIQFIDVRDLAKWIILMIENRINGKYNANGPGKNNLSMFDFLETCKENSRNHANLIWVKDKFLINQKLSPWTELTLWFPENDPIFSGFFTFKYDKAIKEGLTFRPLINTIQDTEKWASTRPDNYEWKAGLHPEKEVELLKLWNDML